MNLEHVFANPESRFCNNIQSCFTMLMVKFDHLRRIEIDWKIHKKIKKKQTTMNDRKEIIRRWSPTTPQSFCRFCKFLWLYLFNFFFLNLFFHIRVLAQAYFLAGTQARGDYGPYRNGSFTWTGPKWAWSSFKLCN